MSTESVAQSELDAIAKILRQALRTEGRDATPIGLATLAADKINGFRATQRTYYLSYEKETADGKNAFVHALEDADIETAHYIASGEARSRNRTMFISTESPRTLESTIAIVEPDRRGTPPEVAE